MTELMVQKLEGKDPVLKVDGRTLPKTNNPPNVKHLRYSRKLPLKCDDCPYRAKQDGGNGICSVYKEGSLCIIRKDIRKEVQKYSTRSPDQILPLMQEEFESNYEKLKFFETLENMQSVLDPEVTKRINAMGKLGQIIQEMKTKKQSVEIEHKKVLSDDKKDQIAQQVIETIKLSQESSNEAES